ncbi:acyl-CoA dehydrogenase family protein [Rhodococcus fascians]|nr:acyl-CoA dehydrogenase family protein [Rhodococcus fascians]MBY4114673.1 acyl-CoA dehydrogenase family protein [Rhodococcus fascians]
MDFGLDKEQELLREAVGDLLERAHDIDELRALELTDRGWRTSVWRSLAEMGVLGIAIPEAFGGMGAGPVEIAVIVEELGRTLAPEPVLDSAVVPGLVLACSRDDTQRAEYLPSIASGEKLWAVAHEESGNRWPHRNVATVAVQDERSVQLHGRKHLVRQGDCADYFIVSAMMGNELGLYIADSAADGLTVTSYKTTDRRRGAHLTLDGVSAVRLDVADAALALQRADSAEQAASCVEAVAIMAEILRITTEYLRSRKQFGAPLSSFQVLSHRAADMYVLLELARSMSLYATAELEDGVTDTLTSSRAKLQVCRSARAIGHDGIHLHGGIGVTEEYSVGQYAARLMAIESRLGGSLDHLELLADQVHTYDKVILG